MIKLGEIEQRLLSELEEAGEENVSALLNAVLPNADQVADREELCGAIARLVSAGFVQMSLARDRNGALRLLPESQVEAALQVIGERLVFDAAKRHWTWSGYRLPLKRNEVQIPEIVATAEGLAKARDILNLRGFRWWGRGK